MRFSRTLIPTLRQDPVDAQIVSHRLMLRAGLVRQLTSGIYSWLPLGLRILRKVEKIVREEMDASGAQEIWMPAVQPAELWKESGRWEFYGKELLRIRDRHDREFCFGPTHEEVISDIVRREIKSYKALPANFYQIQTKFRDEIRPRFGIMRGREFLMKDAYSFHLDDEGLEEGYQAMFAAYKRIFERCGLRFKPVEADTGTIGGASSHEFHVLADSGEDAIASCSHCDYGANLEKAESREALNPWRQESSPDLEKVATPGKETIEEVAEFLNIPSSRTVKSLVVQVDGEWTLLLLRGDHQLNEIKARAALGGDLTLPSSAEVEKETGLPVGSIGPVGSSLPVIADLALEGAGDMVVGANEVGFHYRGVAWERDLSRPRFVDLREVVEGEGCSRCQEGRLEMMRGIEVGHVFKLGKKYAESLGVSVLDPNGRASILTMGCYGIGVSRVVAAAIEQNHDDKGIVWPQSLAPFQVELILLNPKDKEASKVAEELYSDLQKGGLEVLLDDRDERMGVKFNDADLLGIPLRVLVGGRSLKAGVVEIQKRMGGDALKVPPVEAVESIQGLLATLG
ncbi:proline--tRNA ligase [Magnetococcales bacterium HHB-1]